MTHRGFRHIKEYRRILSDTSGNVAIIAAASLIPLMALIGGGVDTGRAYMAKTQLQSACDAGVLAGRRAMGESGVYGDSEKAKAETMFDFNFDANAVSATDVTFETVDNVDGQVTGIATATIPTVLMKIFGKETLALTTDCMAELQIANADVMFVLDTTGSMGGTKIAGLRDAVRDFHRTMNSAVTDANTRVRYGFVPYSMAVNAHDLVASGDLPTSYFRDSSPYESRKAYFNTITYIGTDVDKGTTTETYGSAISKADCTNWGNNDYPTNGSNPIISGTAPSPVTTTTYDYVSWTKTGTTGSGKHAVSIGTCKRTKDVTETTYETKYAFTKWRYQNMYLDTSTFKTLANVSIGTDISSAYSDVSGQYDLLDLAKKNGSELHDVVTTNTSWAGCIEERETVDDAIWDPIPSGATDLDLDNAPYSEATKWRPLWQQVTFSRNNKTYEDSTWKTRNNPGTVCPSPMMLFRDVELSDNPNDVPTWLDDYVNGLVANGNTYHDIGMIWGGRLSSPRGIFAANVNKDDKAVSRHLIFMTDGEMYPSPSSYTSYGIETISNRIAPFGSSLSTITARHTARFLAACEQVKAQGTTVWVIAFGTTLSNDLKTCSSDGRAYFASDSDELKKTFKFIASQVANLRLGQ